MNGLVSVIIPVYNREKYIEECLKTVLNQSYKNFEIIIVDDGSTDNSYNICENIAQTESRIKLFKEDHKGVSNARNKALDNAQGEYVIFVDSDDVIHPELLKNLTDAMVHTNADIAGTDIINVCESNWNKVDEYIVNDSKESVFEYKTNDEAINKMFSGGSPINLAGGTMLKTSLISDTRFRTDLFIAEDFYFVYENLIKGANVVYTNPKRYFCRIHNKNSSWNFDFSGFLTRFESRKLAWENEAACGRINNSNRIKSTIFNIYLRCAIAHTNADKDVKKMAKVLIKYKKIILPTLPLKSKVRFYLYVFFPFTYFWAKKLKNKLTKIKNIKQ